MIYSSSDLAVSGKPIPVFFLAAMQRFHALISVQ